MIYDARQIANWFVTRAQRDGKNLSIMSLLKLTYIAHGWHLETQGTPLFPNKIEAWQYGPVIPDVYHDFRRYGVTVEKPIGTVPSPILDQEDGQLLEQVWNIYGNLPAFRLSDITHVPGGPWEIASQIGGNRAPITDDLIRNHYQMLRAKAKALADTGTASDA